MEPAEIMSAVDIVEYIQRYTELKPIGGGEYKGLSPFTSERTPSFFVNANKQKFFDYSGGSGYGGNIAEFVKRMNNCTFPEAINILKAYAGIDDSDMPVNRLAADSVAKRFRRSADKSIVSHTYLPDNVMDGYVWDEEKLKPWFDEGISYDVMRKFQVRFDPPSNRIVYPIRDMDGRVINVAGRTLVPDWKELGLRKYTYMYALGTLDTLCCYWENRKAIAEKKEIIVVEGAKSVMKLCGWGYENAAAICTSHLNSAQQGLLIKLGCSVVFALDAEVNVRQDSNILKLRSYTQVYTLENWDKLLGEKDAPVDKGKEVFETLYNKRTKL